MPLRCTRCGKMVPVYERIPEDGPKDIDNAFTTRAFKMPVMPIVDYDEKSTSFWVFFQCQFCAYPNLYISVPLYQEPATGPGTFTVSSTTPK